MDHVNYGKMKVIENNSETEQNNDNNNNVIIKHGESIIECLEDKNSLEKNAITDDNQESKVDSYLNVFKESNDTEMKNRLENEEKQNACKLIVLRLIKNLWRKKCIQINELRPKLNKLEHGKDALNKILSIRKLSLQDEQDRYSRLAKDYTNLKREYKKNELSCIEVSKHNKSLKIENKQLEKLIKETQDRTSNLKMKVTKHKFEYKKDVDDFLKMFKSLVEEFKQIAKTSKTLNKKITFYEDYINYLKCNLVIPNTINQFGFFNNERIQCLKEFENKLKSDKANGKRLSTNLEEINRLLLDCHLEIIEILNSEAQWKSKIISLKKSFYFISSVFIVRTVFGIVYKFFLSRFHSDSS